MLDVLFVVGETSGILVLLVGAYLFVVGTMDPAISSDQDRRSRE